MARPLYGADAKSVAKRIADRVTQADRLADELTVALSDAYARGYSDGRADRFPVGIAACPYADLQSHEHRDANGNVIPCADANAVTVSDLRALGNTAGV